MVDLIHLKQQAEADLFTSQEWLFLASRLELSPRQLEVARLVCDGHKNLIVAQQLGVSIETIKTHLRRMYDKLDVNDRFDMLRLMVYTVRSERMWLEKPSKM